MRVTLDTKQSQYFFGSFVHRDETFNLVYYLWKNPPSYVEVQDQPTSFTSNRPSSSSSNSPLSSSPASYDPFKSTPPSEGLLLCS